MDETLVYALRKRYGLDQPVYVQYLKWIGNIVLRGDFGRSMQWNRPVSELIWERMLWTVVISFSTMIFTWVVAFPIGVYSATHQYSSLDYLFTLFGFVGRGLPGFMIALVLLWKPSWSGLFGDRALLAAFAVGWILLLTVLACGVPMRLGLRNLERVEL